MTSATGTGGSDFLLAGALLILCHYFKVFCRKQAKGSEPLRIRNLLELIGRFELPTSSFTKDKEGNLHTFPADTVVLAAGFRARQDVAASLCSSDYDFAVIGDARRARRVLNAVREGYDAATFVR